LKQLSQRNHKNLSSCDDINSSRGQQPIRDVPATKTEPTIQLNSVNKFYFLTDVASSWLVNTILVFKLVFSKRIVCIQVLKY